MTSIQLWKSREWQFALISGVLIVFAWVLETSAFMISAAIIYLLAYAIGGFYKAKEGIVDFFKERKLNVEILMIIAAIGAAIIGYWAEGALLIFIFAMSGALETYTMNKSEKELSALMDLQPQEATVLEGDREMIVPAKQLRIGDRILVKPGERIPTDGVVVHGSSTVDESALSGESIPLLKQMDDEVFAGTVNGNGSLQIYVTKRMEETLFQKIIDLVQSTKAEKPPSHQFIERFESGYVKTVFIVTALMLFLPHYILGWSWTETWYRAMVLLVVASPCALIASIMPATLSAVSNGARQGILFKGGVHLEKLAQIRAVAFDKTGTLTNGEPEVTDVLVREGESKKEILHAVVSIENQSTHPLSHAMIRYAHTLEITDFSRPEAMKEIDGFGIEATLHGTTWRIGKRDFVSDNMATFFPDEVEQFQQDGKTIVYVANDTGPVAVIALEDTIREEAKHLMKQLNKNGIHTVMLTGDHQRTSQSIAKQAGMKEYVANCLPEDKVAELKKLKEKYGSVAMVGDGINDAPALATATTGIAMGAGTDVAMETADIVLMKDELSSITHAFRLSKRMNRIVRQNIIFSIAVIVLLIGANFTQELSLPLGVIGHEGSTILVILNGLRLLRD